MTSQPHGWGQPHHAPSGNEPSNLPAPYGQQGWEQQGQQWSQQQGWEQPGWEQQAYGQNPAYDHQGYGRQPAYDQQQMQPAYGMPPMRPKMDMGQAYNAFWKNFATFEGRAGKGEFWWVFLINLIIAVPLSFVGIGVLYSIAALIPGLALSIRRLHDVNKSGWWLLLCLIPFAGLVILFFYAQDSDPAGAQYDAPNGVQPQI